MKVYPDHLWEASKFGKYEIDTDILATSLMLFVREKKGEGVSVDDLPYNKRKLIYSKPFQKDLKIIVQSLFPSEGILLRNVNV